MDVFVPMRLTVLFALTAVLLADVARATQCTTLQSCVDAATVSQKTLNVILPAVLQASLQNCNVSITGSSLFDRVVVSGSGPSSTAIDCTSSGTLSTLDEPIFSAISPARCI
jgi:hypothetical protein